MAQPHASFGEVIAAGPLGADWPLGHSLTLVRETDLHISRLVLPAGHRLKPHRVPQRLVIQCLEGRLVFETMGRPLVLNPGDLCHLPPDETHAVHALENSSALLTLIDTHANPSRPSGETP